MLHVYPACMSVCRQILYMYIHAIYFHDICKYIPYTYITHVHILCTTSKCANAILLQITLEAVNNTYIDINNSRSNIHKLFILV